MDKSGHIAKTVNSRPDIPYIVLIVDALKEAGPSGMLTLPEIYEKIMTKYPYFRTAPPRWRNSVRHNLSLHPIFARIAPNDKSKGSYWKFATGGPEEEPKPQSALKPSLALQKEMRYVKTHPIHSIEKIKWLKSKKKRKISVLSSYDDHDDPYAEDYWSPVVEISRLSAGESEDDDEDSFRKRMKNILNLNYGEDFLQPDPIEYPQDWVISPNYNYPWYNYEYFDYYSSPYTAPMNKMNSFRRSFYECQRILPTPQYSPPRRPSNNASSRLADSSSILYIQQ